MAEILDSDLVWHQIILTDSEGLSGASVAAFVQLIIREVRATAVLVSDLVGACPELMAYEGNVLTVDDFLQKAANAIQYDWAFFFLYSKPPKSQKATTSDEKTTMLRAEVTVRLADDQYFYVYSRNQKLMSALLNLHPEAEYKTSGFKELDIPY